MAMLRKPQGAVPPALKPLEEGPKGWLEFRAQATRSPTPWLAAGVGHIVGQNLYELLRAPAGDNAETAPEPAAKPSVGVVTAPGLQGPIRSFGGPYIVLPQAVASAWPGAGDKAAYEEIGRGPAEGRLSRLGGRDMLVLGTPDPLYVAPLARGAVFARAVGFDADDDTLLAKLLQSLPEDGWQALGKLVVSDGPLIAFDASVAGADAEFDVLRVELSPGTYAVDSRTFQPDAGTELLLTRIEQG